MRYAPALLLACVGACADGVPSEERGAGVDGTGGDALSGRTSALPVDEPLHFATFEELHQELAARAREGLFSGVVLIAEGDEVRFQRAYGLAYRGDLWPGNVRPNMPDTRFNIGSLDKLFTSVVVLRLAQEGRLDLDEPIGTYLTDLESGLGDGMTARHLLQHRAGLGDYIRHPAYQRSPERFRTVAALMELVRDEPLHFEPGEGQQYSNNGYVVLGAVIQGVTGRTYHEAVREMVLQPAGMRATGPTPDSQSATGYARDDRGALISTEGHWTSAGGTPAGGGYSTAADLHRFLLALMEDRLLEPSYTDTLLRYFEGPGGEPIDRTGGWDADWGGGAPGLNASIGFLPGTNRIFAVLANLDPPAAATVGRSILRQGR